MKTKKKKNYKKSNCKKKLERTKILIKFKIKKKMK